MDKPGWFLLAGCLSGFSAIITTYPLDVMRARMATDNSYKNTSDVVMRAIFSKDPKLSLVRGLAPSLLGNVPLTGVSFFVHDLFKTKYFMEVEATANKDRLSLLLET